MQKLMAHGNAREARRYHGSEHLGDAPLNLVGIMKLAFQKGCVDPHQSAS